MNVNTDNIANTLQGFSVSPLRSVWRRPCGLCLAALRWRKSQTSSLALFFFFFLYSFEDQGCMGNGIVKRAAAADSTTATCSRSCHQCQLVPQCCTTKQKEPKLLFLSLSLFLSSPHTPALFSLCVVILRLMMQGSQGFNRDREFVGEKVLCSLTSHQVIAMGHVS